MKSTRGSVPSLAIIGILLALLLASLVGNYFLYHKAILFYEREAAVRIEPISDRYEKDNAELLAQPKTRPRIIIFGESRCAMWRPHHPQNWGDVEIVNRGIGAETTPQMLGRLESDVLALDPDLVILQMGDNDLKTIAMLERRSKAIVRQTHQNILKIANTLSEAGIQVLITTIFPPAEIELLRKPLWSDKVNESIDYVNAQLLAYEGPKITTVDCDAILRDGKYIKDGYSLDTLHLNEAGYHALNQQLEPIVKSLLSK